MEFLIGTSGYSYKHWADGVFYPPDVPQKRWLEFYCGKFNTVELNVTFYRLPKKETFKGWEQRSPKDFVFVVKGSRYITHIRRLKSPAESLKKLGVRVAPLQKKIGCFLWQLPPRFKKNAERLEGFCRQLKKKPHFKDARHVFEFRDESWFDQDVYRILKDYNYALCFIDADRYAGGEVLTAYFVYVRFHGRQARYGSDYSKPQLKRWAGKIKAWQKDIDAAYVFFNNDAHGFAPKNATTLRELLWTS